MLSLGIIGTNWITKQFIDAAHETNEWQLSSVYSRTIKKAHEFGDSLGASEFFDDLTKFFSEGNFEAVYIASPNSLHFEQALDAIRHEKITIVEKSMVINPTQWRTLESALKDYPKAKLFEAARHVHEPNFKVVQQAINNFDVVQGASLTYAKYSSRYDAVLNGEKPNIFSLDFAGGALQDLGVYVVYDAVAWFGMPEEVGYFPQKIRTRVDGKGTAILRYPQFDVTLNIGKIANSYVQSEIYGLKDTIVMDNAAELNSIRLYDEHGEFTEIGTKPEKNPMVAEAKDFADIINHFDDEKSQNKYYEWLQLSRNVNKLMFNLRQNAGLYFTGEEDKD